jgi:hypothetical protein
MPENYLECIRHCKLKDHVLNELNFEFKKLLICIILQINYQMHLLITKVSFKPINQLQVCAKKSGGTK